MPWMKYTLPENMNFIVLLRCRSVYWALPTSVTTWGGPASGAARL